ncbi:hypothetical protein NA78x_001797 [Anatilimnocola sp. NA78]|uniref:hypothetical protein n=1 Tax=Anatilimnocola sp. NA78 TaxID=3415683 RepID=UPI003CE57EBC
MLVFVASNATLRDVFSRMEPLMFPNLPNGHLYQWITTFGALLAVVSVAGVGIQVRSQNEMVRQHVGKLLEVEKPSGEYQKFWSEIFVSESNNTKFVVGFLMVTTLIGLVFACCGGYFWYSKVQWYEDERRRLGHVDKSHDVDKKTGVKKLTMP